MSKVKLPKIFIAFDIEASDTAIGTPILSCGYAIGDEKREIIAKGKINMKNVWPVFAENYVDEPGPPRTPDELLELNKRTIVSYGDFSKKCWDEFWYKSWYARGQPLIKRLTDGAINHNEGIAKIRDLLNEYKTKYPETQYKIVFLSDNAAFDIAFIDYWLNRLFNYRLRASSSGKLMPLKGPDDMVDMLPEKYVDRRLEEFGFNHDHDPMHDAEGVLFQHYIALEAKAVIEKSNLFV